MEKVLQYLKDAGKYYLATVNEEGRPRLRPFGTSNIFDGKLYIQTGLVKDVAKQLIANPAAEIVASGADGGWIRISGDLILDERVEAKKSMLDAHPGLRRMYDENDNNTAVFYFRNATAVINKTGGAEPEIIKFG